MLDIFKTKIRFTPVVPEMTSDIKNTAPKERNSKKSGRKFKSIDNHLPVTIVGESRLWNNHGIQSKTGVNTTREQNTKSKKISLLKRFRKSLLNLLGFNHKNNRQENQRRSIISVYEEQTPSEDARPAHNDDQIDNDFDDPTKTINEAFSFLDKCKPQLPPKPENISRIRATQPPQVPPKPENISRIRATQPPQVPPKPKNISRTRATQPPQVPPKPSHLSQVKAKSATYISEPFRIIEYDLGII